MDNEALSTARARAQEAISRARLATDPDIKKQWAEVAEGWMTLLAQLEGKAKPRPEKAGS